MDANVGNWPKVIAEAQKLKVQHVLPGHGESAVRSCWPARACS